MSEEEFTKFFDAVRSGDIATVEAFLESNPSLKEWRFLGKCLACAASAGQLQVGKFLADSGAGVEDNDVAMTAAIRSGNVDFAKFLQERGFEFSVRVVQENLLFAAIHHGHADVVKWLASDQIDPGLVYETINGEWVNAMSYAQANDQAEIVALLKKLGCRVPRTKLFKDTPQKEYDYLRSDVSQIAPGTYDLFWHAIDYYDTNQLAQLLAQTPAVRDDVSVVLGLASTASKVGQLSTLKLFESELKLPVEQQGKSTINSCLRDAVYAGHLPVVEYLIELGADVNYQEPRGKGLISDAVFFAESLEVAKCLHQNGSRFRTDDYDANPMYHAVANDREDIVRWLLTTDFDPHVTYRSTSALLTNALAYAKKCEHTGIVTALEAAGCRMPVEGKDIPVRDYVANFFQVMRGEEECRQCFDAIRAGDVAAVETFIEKHSFLGERGDFASDCVYCAASHGQVQVGESIIGAWRSVDEQKRTIGRYGPLITAIREGHLEFAKLLHENRADFLMHSLHVNPLFVAIAFNQPLIVDWLLIEEVDPHVIYELTTKGEYINALSFARDKQLPQIASTLEQVGCQLPTKSAYKQQEIEVNESDVAELTLSPENRCWHELRIRDSASAISMIKSNNGLSSDSEFMRKLLVFAASSGQLSFVKSFQSIVQSDEEVMFGCLYEAAGEGHLEIVQYLHGLGADLTHENPSRFQKGLMRKAVGNGHLDLAQYLYANGVLLNADSIQDNTLFLAISEGRVDLVKWILSTGFAPNVCYRTKKGALKNALSHAQGLEEWPGIVTILKSAGCEAPTEENVVE